ncbi:hypothetical protein CDL15_Pgr012341 [Punica granatum]|uniref:Uncharacterized protein n=1 Tax=Punica granatum TaxID=22663 RepID=A0A218X6B5_PUNGR|nr:hypothetical protein CDL15_Pgr012341 [Punica granatum]
MQPKRGKLSAPHFGPPASHTRISDRGPGHYSSPGNQRRIVRHGVMNNGRRGRSLRKAEESHQKSERTRNPQNDGLALWHNSSSSHRSTERRPIWDSKNPSQCQSDQRHIRVRSGDILVRPGHPDVPRTPFLAEISGPAPLTGRRPL